MVGLILHGNIQPTAFNIYSFNLSLPVLRAAYQLRHQKTIWLCMYLSKPLGMRITFYCFLHASLSFYYFAAQSANFENYDSFLFYKPQDE